MTISYTYHYRFLPEKWTAPSSPPICDNEHEDLLKTLEYRRLIAPFLKDWLSVLDTWMFIIKYGIIPMLIIAILIGGIGWLTFMILSLIVAIISIVIWVKIKIFHRTVAIVQIIIDEVLKDEYSIKLPKILEEE